MISKLFKFERCRFCNESVPFFIWMKYSGCCSDIHNKLWQSSVQLRRDMRYINKLEYMIKDGKSLISILSKKKRRCKCSGEET